MARRSLKPQLNQIRAWVHQGRTDAWIAHQLEVSANELREFRKQYDLSPDDENAGSSEIDLRDEIEAEIEAATEAEEAEEEKQAESDEGQKWRDGGDHQEQKSRPDAAGGHRTPKRLCQEAARWAVSHKTLYRGLDEQITLFTLRANRPRLLDAACARIKLDTFRGA